MLRNYSNVTNLGLEYEGGLENASGIQEEAFLIPLSFLQTEAKPVADGTTAESLVTIATSHTLKAGKAPIPCTPMFGKSGEEFKSAGEVGSLLAEGDTVFFVPTISAKSVGSLVVLRNFRGIVLVRRPGQVSGFWQIGSKGMPAKTSAFSGGLGTGTGEVGIKLTISNTDVTPLYEYTGELPVAAGV
jgi:hypothetical protein